MGTGQTDNDLHGRLSALEARFADLDRTLLEISSDVKKLISFRSALLGIAAAVSAVVSWIGAHLGAGR